MSYPNASKRIEPKLLVDYLWRFFYKTRIELKLTKLDFLEDNFGQLNCLKNSRTLGYET